MNATKTITFHGEEAKAIADALARKDAEIESLRQQLASLEQEVEQCCYGESLAFAAMRQQLSAAQAKIDELMLEYCPEEKTNEQIAEYEKHQRAVTEPKL